MKGWKLHSLQTDAQSLCLEAFPRDNGPSPKHSDANPQIGMPYLRGLEPVISQYHTDCGGFQAWFR